MTPSPPNHDLSSKFTLLLNIFINICVWSDFLNLYLFVRILLFINYYVIYNSLISCNKIWMWYCMYYIIPIPLAISLNQRRKLNFVISLLSTWYECVIIWRIITKRGKCLRKKKNTFQKRYFCIHALKLFIHIMCFSSIRQLMILVNLFLFWYYFSKYNNYFIKTLWKYWLTVVFSLNTA